jgi:3-hydroxyisobutyrate dehydrogenase
MPRDIAFLGLGVMGGPMAGRLVAAGHRVTVYNRTAARGDALVAAGATRVATPREAAAGKEIVLSIVTDGPDVQQVLLGPEGAVQGAAPGTLFVDMSTIAPEVARSVGHRW